MSIILKAENISKQYRLGLVGTGTISDDIKRWWYRIRSKEDPFIKIGETNDRTSYSDSDYVWALQDINFEVKAGEVLGIIGSNGAGKSTLLKILSRVTMPTTGEIKSRGRIASLLEVGTGFHGELTGRENIYLNGAILGMTKAEIRSKEDEIIAFSGCERYVDTPVKRYSSGMNVRLAFAVAAFLEPDILVIDEVLAVGDAEFQKKAIGKMQDISMGEGRTVLFVSHDMHAIQELCTKLLVLGNGKVNFEGSVNEGIDYYLSKSTDQSLHYINDADNAIIKEALYMDNNNNLIHKIPIGKEILIKLNYYNPNNLDLSFSIGFFDVFSNFLFSCRSDVLNLTFDKINGSATLIIAKWPLSKGYYFYNLAAHTNDKMIFNVKGAGRIFVENGDFYGTGKLPGHNKAIYIDYDWR